MIINTFFKDVKPILIAKAGNTARNPNISGITAEIKIYQEEQNTPPLTKNAGLERELVEFVNDLNNLLKIICSSTILHISVIKKASHEIY